MTTYRTDTPADLSPGGVDAFGHRDYATALAKTVRSVETPFTFGLFGEWGSGKTTILEEVERQLSENGRKEAAVVVFDAWRYEGEEALRREFLTDISERLEKKKQFKKGSFRRKLLEELRTERTEPVPRAKPTMREVLVTIGQIAAAAAVVLLTVWLLQGPLGLTDKSVERSYPVVIAAALAFALTSITRAIRVEHVQVRTPRLQDPDLFTRRFRRLVRGVKAKRLVIAIDNLDRCSPARVSEMLSTIKTFLEPDAGDRELVFIIAADDKALRRHLTAQEVSQSPTDVDPTTAEREARDAVDEYLRKFFNASVRVVDALDEEIQAYTRGELREFFESEKVAAEVRDDVVDMVVSALRRNPRRIKQFVNNLQMKLDLLRERETSGRIKPAVSGDIPLVAKLLIIEEKWFDRYDDLREDHRLLLTWHSDAAEPRGVDDPPPEDPEWDAFMLATAHIDTRAARAVIHLKLEELELELPLHTAFVEALDVGRGDEVARILDEAKEDERDGYARALASHYRVQLRRGSVNEPLGTVRALAEVPRLPDEYPEQTAEVLANAVHNPRVSTRLGDIDADGLLRAGATLTDADFRRLVVRTTEAAAARGEDAEGEFLYELPAALPPYIDRLDDDTKGVVRDAIGSSETNQSPANDFETYLPLVDEAPEFLPERAVDAALETLAEASLAGPEDPAYRVAVLGVTHGVGPKRAAQALLEKTGAVIGEGVSERPDAALAFVQDALRWVPQATGLPFEAIQQQLEQTTPLLATAPSPEFRTALVELGIELVRLTDEPRQQELAASLLDPYISGHTGEALTFLEDRGGTLPEAAQREAAGRLASIAGSDVDLGGQAVRALRVLPDPGERLVDATRQAITAPNPPLVRIILEEGKSALSEDELSAVIDLLVNHVPGYQPAQRAAGWEPLLALEAADLTDAQLDKVRENLCESISAGIPGAPELINSFAASPAWKTVAAAVWSELATRVAEQAETNLPNLGNEFATLAHAKDSLKAAQRHAAIQATLAGLKTDGAQVGVARPFLQGVAPAASIHHRNQYANALLDIEPEQGLNFAARQALLELADDIAPTSGTPANKKLQKRLKDLIKGGSDEEKAMAQAVADRR